MSANRQQAAKLAVVRQTTADGAEVERRLWAAISDARRHGASWASIGEALGGISKQAAQQRFDVLDRRYRGTQLTIAQQG